MDSAAVAGLLKLVLAYGAVFAPQLLAALQQYQAVHPSPTLQLVIQILGAAILQLHKPADK